MFPRLPTALVPAALVLTGCKGMPDSPHGGFSHFTGLTDFSQFSREQNSDHEVVLLSPKIKSHIEWEQLVLSWNAPFGRSKLSVKMTALLEALAANGVRHMWL